MLPNYFFLLPFAFLFLHVSSYTPTDHYLLDCGSSYTSSTDDNGRIWYTDDNSTFSSPIATLHSASSPNTLTGAADPKFPKIPYHTARVFHSKFTYSFPVKPGPKFLRLYFYSSSYSADVDQSEFFFSVSANKYSLLFNFTSPINLTTDAHFPREFYIPIADTDQGTLNLTFSPAAPNYYAYVNGIEIISVPENLYINHGNTTDLNFINYQGQTIPAGKSTAMETSYRLNVGGSEITGDRDTGMYRRWAIDDDFIEGEYFGTQDSIDQKKVAYSASTPAYTAPEKVYQTLRHVNTKDPYSKNLTWSFELDNDFYYLVRLHFCEIQANVTKELERLFIIYIHNQTAENPADVIRWSNGNGIPVVRDYAVYMSGDKGTKAQLWLAMFPYIPAKFPDVLLNGLEIFKLNQIDGNLAVPNQPLLRAPNVLKQGTKNRSSSVHLLPVILGGVIGGLAVLVLVVSVFAIVIRRRRRTKKTTTSNYINILPYDSGVVSTSSGRTCNSSVLPSELCHHFSLEEIKIATHNFDQNNIIGVGGFGSVYKGYVSIEGTATMVAVKRLDPLSKQGVHEFTTEIDLLSKLRHVHLVSLMGYSDDNNEMILVYEYMSRGTLRDHLYNSDNKPLSWKDRLMVCIGAAKGLHYLHSSAGDQKIIHRDVKSTNILLDEKWRAKVSDFGLSKLGPMGTDHVTTVVKGSFGYLDPEYYKRQQLSEKSDVYSFGVVLFEVLCARPVILNQRCPKEQVNLASWARKNCKSGNLQTIVDVNLVGQIAPECLKKFGEIAESCLKDYGSDRPSMGDVVGGLEFALQLQETAEKDAKDGNFLKGDPKESKTELSQTILKLDSNDDTSGASDINIGTETSSSSGGTGRLLTNGSVNSSDSSNVLFSSKAVFSQIMGSEGR